VYNDNNIVLWTDALPELHRDFASRICLKFEDMPGGKLSTEDVKTRIADARARVIVVSTIGNVKMSLATYSSTHANHCCSLLKIILAWEQSGTGFGCRAPSNRSAETDAGWGRYIEVENGDDRANFIKSKDHRSHHLYLWHLGDTMGILKHVLNVLSPEVQADSETIPGGTAQTQGRRVAKITKDKADKSMEKVQKNAFRDSIGASMNRIAIASIASEQRKDEEKAVQYEEQMHDAEDAGEDAKAKRYKNRMEYHQGKVYAYEVELRGLRGLPSLDAEEEEEEDNDGDDNEESDDDSKANKRQKTVATDVDEGDDDDEDD
jgi:hypothetical protein